MDMAGGTHAGSEPGREGAVVDPTFKTLMGCHSLFLDLMAVHQERLRDGDLPGARATFREFRNALMLHVEDEEKYVLPIFGARMSAASEADGEVFHHEHGRLVRLLEDMGRRVSALEPGEDLGPTVAALLEVQENFRRLFIAHAQREELLLYPHMDRLTTLEERKRLLVLCRLPDPMATLALLRPQRQRPASSTESSAGSAP